MIPKKAKDFKKPTAEELGLPEDLVRNFIDFYWEKVRKNITELNHEALYITNLGTFRIKHWKIDETVERLKSKIKGAEGKFERYNLKTDLTDRIQKLEKIKTELEEQELKFKKISDARKNKDDMEEQDPNTSGSDEQDLQEGSC